VDWSKIFTGPRLPQPPPLPKEAPAL